MTPPKIGIIGAGPGGLTLANLLHQSSIPYTLYELDPTPTARNQGGTLDLHPSGGQLALRAANLWSAFTASSRPESDVLKIVSASGTILWDGASDAAPKTDAEKFAGRPEIDRSALKGILLQNLDPAAIRWGKKLLSAVTHPSGQGKHNLCFADGEVAGPFDLVVGADGAWSKIRPLVTDQKPFYSGISALELWEDRVEERKPWMSRYVGAGSLFSFDEGRTIQSQRIGDGSVRTYACLRCAEGFLSGGFEKYDFECAEEKEAAKREFVERFFGDVGEELKRLVLGSGNAGMICRELYMLPVGMRWEGKKGATLLGDAAHLMTPFAGVGVNAAMADALALGNAIKEAVVGSECENENKSLEAAIQEYEMELFVRGEAFATKTAQNMDKHFSPGGSEEMAKKLRAAYGNAL